MRRTTQPQWRVLAALLMSALAGACSLDGAGEPATPTAVALLPTVEATPVATVTLTPAPTATSTSTPAPPPTPFRDVMSGPEGGTQLYLRVAPGLLAAVETTINSMAAVQAVGRTPNALWLEVRLDDGTQGWLLAASVPDLADDALPTTADDPADPAVVALVPPGDAVPLRARPDDVEATVNAEAAALGALAVLGRTDDGTWLRVQTADDVQGWARGDALLLNTPADAISVVPPAYLSADGEVHARVRADAGGLRLRQLPDGGARVLLNLRAGTPLLVEGRTRDGAWVLVTLPEGYKGYTAADFLDWYIPRESVPTIDDPQAVALFDLPVPADAPQVVSSVGGGARSIYLRGQQQGNQRGVFTTVGDSLTDTPYFLRHIATGYNLRDYGYLLPALQFFSAPTPDGLTYARRSVAARASWSTFSVLEAPGGACQPGESALSCELRLLRPSVALVLIGTNDAPAFPADTFRENLTRITQATVDMGVVPVLSTLPPRAQHNDTVLAYNAVVQSVAAQYGVPVWDLYAAVAGLPNQGLDGDGVHLSVPPGGAAATVDFTADNLRYGTTMRNLTALQTLDALMRQVLY